MARYEFQKHGSNVQMFKEFESLLKKQTCICSVNVIVSKMASSNVLTLLRYDQIKDCD